MQIFVRVEFGRTITLNVEANESIESVKEKIWAREGVPIEMQRLFYGCKFLQPGRNLADFGVKEEVTLQLNYATVVRDPKRTERKAVGVVSENTQDESCNKRRCVQI
jgi:hypothetical protein